MIGLASVFDITPQIVPYLWPDLLQINGVQDSGIMQLSWAWLFQVSLFDLLAQEFQLLTG